MKEYSAIKRETTGLCSNLDESPENGKGWGWQGAGEESQSENPTYCMILFSDFS